jgi:hypothetical protein
MAGSTGLSPVLEAADGGRLRADRLFSEDIASQAHHYLHRKFFCSTRADVVVQHQNQDLLLREEKVRL